MRADDVSSSPWPPTAATSLPPQPRRRRRAIGTAPLVAEARVWAMGTACHLVVVGGPPGLIARAVGVIDGLDARRAANPTVATGFAADVAVEELRRDGAAGACVDLGGVVAVSGQAPAGGEVWHVGVCGSATVGISDAGVATVHVPMTTAGLRAITVVAESAARAQALAIAAWRAGGLTLVSEAGAAALAIDGTGAVHTTPGVEPYLSAA